MNMKSLCVILATFWASGLIACGQSTTTTNNGPVKNSPSHFVIGPSAILMPEGAFLLVRKGGKIGAVRFTRIEQGSTVGTGKATYESYFLGDGSGLFNSPTTRKRTGEINVKPLKGFHPFAFQSGKTKVEVGDWSFESDAPGSLYMWPYGRSEKDYGYEFAPTSALKVEEIDASDKRLKWFTYNATTKVVLPMSDLPK